VRHGSIMILAALSIGGCASYADLGNGRYAKTVLSEERSPFGTNGGFVQLQDCKGEKEHWYSFRTYSDCQPITAWVPVSSQGQGGIIVAGALTGIGIGVAGALIPSTTNQANAVVTAPRGHHR
jgi:hypothetical protein